MSQPTTLSKHDIEQIYDGAAVTYDRVGPVFYANCAARLVQSMPVTPGMHVMDVATGTGAVLIEAAKRVGAEGRVVGIDFSEGILREAERAVTAACLKNVELRKMDAEHLEFPDRSFDAVTCAFALFMFHDMEGALREMYRVCKPGGYIGVTYFTRTPPPFDPGWAVFARACTEYNAGFRMPQKLGLTAEELGVLLAGAGFRGVSTNAEVKDLVYATAEDWWGFMFTQGTRAAILSMDGETRARFKQDYLARLAPALREDGYHMTTGVIYATARR